MSSVSAALSPLISETDADQISRKFGEERQELFTLRGEKWEMRQAHPCQWWNPKKWPLGINDNDSNSIVPQSECNHAVVVVANKTVISLQAIEAAQVSQAVKAAAGNSDCPAPLIPLIRCRNIRHRQRFGLPYEATGSASPAGVWLREGLN